MSTFCSTYLKSSTIIYNILSFSSPLAILIYIILIFLITIGIIYFYNKYKSTYLKLELDKQLELNKELESANKFQRNMLRNISHDLKIPLNGIIGLSDTLLDNTYVNLSTYAKRHLNLILNNGKYLDNMVNDLYDLSSVKNTSIHLTKSPIDLRLLVDEIFTVTRYLIFDKNIEFSNEILRDFFMAYGDDKRVRQILQNLIENSIKFTKRGHIKVSAEKINDFIKVSVIDTGKGIEESNLKNIVDDLENAKSTESNILGIGLNITNELVKLHGGTFEIDSVYEKGTVSAFTIPVCKESSINEKEYTSHILNDLETKKTDLSTEELIEVEQTDTNGISILVIDDELVSQQIIYNYLSNDGYSVTGVSTGEKANELFNDNKHFDIAIVDINLKDESAYTLCKNIRKTHSMFDLPIIMLSDKNKSEEISEAFKSGANNYILKPFAKNELLNRVTSNINLKKAVLEKINETKNNDSTTMEKLLAESISKLNTDITSVETLSDLIKKLVESINGIITYDTISVIMNNESMFKVEYYKGDRAFEVIEDFVKNKFTFKIVNNLFKEKLPFIVENCSSDISPTSSLLFNTLSNSWLGIPFIHKNNIQGVVILESIKNQHFNNYNKSLLTAYVGQVNLVLEKFKLQDEIKNMTLIDSLTGLSNRKHFFDLGDKVHMASIRYKENLSIMMIDIDHFKNFNDKYGRTVGDEILKYFGKILIKNTRDVDIIGRYGSVEFAIILPKTDIKKAVTIAERIKENLGVDGIVTENFGELFITVSMGISELKKNQKLSLDELFTKADKRLYIAKAKGRDRIEISD